MEKENSSKHRNLNLLLVIALLCIAGSLAGQSSKITIEEEEIDKVFVSYEGEPGIAVGILHNDQVIYNKGFGYANLDYNIKVTPQTVFESGALSMQITGALIMLLENEGKLSLNDPIRKYIPELPQYKEGEPTIAHCLQHSGGVRDYLEMIKMKGSSMDITFDNHAAINLLKRQSEPTIIPGSDYRYSYSGYLILAVIVERITGKTFGEYAKQQIFEPLQMTKTFIYESPEKIVKNRAISYEKIEGEYRIKQRFNFVTSGDGRLYTTTEDFLKWAKNYSNSKIGTKEFMQQLFKRGVLNNGDTISYALGLEHGTLKGHKLYAHNGYWSGFTAMFIHFPEDDISIVTIGNNVNMSASPKAWDVADLLFKNVAPVGGNEVKARKEVKLSSSNKKEFINSYFDYRIGYARKIYLKNDTLFYSDSENPDLKLMPISKNEFTGYHVNSQTKINFKKSTSGSIDMFFTRGGRPPIKFSEYKPYAHSKATMKKFEGKYYSIDLNALYDVTVENDQLVITCKGNELARYNGLTENIFNSGHDGYLEFEESNNEVKGFTLNDYWLGSMRFIKDAKTVNTLSIE